MSGITADFSVLTGTAPQPAPTPAPAGRAVPRRVPRWLWAVPPVAALGLLFVYPLVLVVQQSLHPDTDGTSFAAYGQVFDSPVFTKALATTIEIAVESTVGALLLGGVLALIVSFVPFPGGRLLAGFVDVFLAFPSFLITLALLFVYGTAGIANSAWTDVSGGSQGPFDFLNTPWGVVLAEVTFYTPFVMRPLLAAFSQLDSSLLDAAASLGARPARIVRQVILPEALPALAAGGGLVLVLCLNEFGIVLFTGAKSVVTLPMYIYSKAILENDYPSACVVAVLNIGVSVGMYVLYRVLLARIGAGGRRVAA
jgi:2-aminoethylphosphonate transport system permease protein